MDARTRRLLWLWLPVVLWAGVIAGLSHVPGLKSPFRLDYLYRKVAHVFEYLVLAALLARAFRGSGWERGWLAAAFLASTLFAASDELHQNFVPRRYGTFRDFGFDAFGTLLGLAAYAGLLRRSRYGTQTRTALPEERLDRLPDPGSLPPRS